MYACDHEGWHLTRDTKTPQYTVPAPSHMINAVIRQVIDMTGAPQAAVTAARASYPCTMSGLQQFLSDVVYRRVVFAAEGEDDD